MFATIEEYKTEAEKLLFYMEVVVVIWFSIEFCLRYVKFPLKKKKNFYYASRRHPLREVLDGLPALN